MANRKPKSVKRLPHWTDDDVAKWEANKPDLLYEAGGLGIEVERVQEQLKREWQLRVGSSFPGFSPEAIEHVAAWAEIKREDVDAKTASQIYATALAKMARSAAKEPTNYSAATDGDNAVMWGRSLGHDLDDPTPEDLAEDRPQPASTTRLLKNVVAEIRGLKNLVDLDKCDQFSANFAHAREQAADVERMIQRLRLEFAESSRLTLRTNSVEIYGVHYSSVHLAVLVWCRCQLFTVLAAIDPSRIEFAVNNNTTLSFDDKDVKCNWEAVKCAVRDGYDNPSAHLPQLELELAAILKAPIQEQQPTAPVEKQNNRVPVLPIIHSDAQGATIECPPGGVRRSVSHGLAAAVRKMIDANGQPVGIGGNDLLRKPAEDIRRLQTDFPELAAIIERGRGNTGYRLTIFDHTSDSA